MRGWLGVFAAAGLMFVSAQAHAEGWAIDYSKSRLSFNGMQGSLVFEGNFGKFDVDVNLNPDHPETGKITVNIDIASAATGDGDRDGMMPQSDWFNVAKFPQAQFVSSAIRRVGEGTSTNRGYEAVGALTIKGVSKPVKILFTLAQERDHWRALGKTTLMRNDFKVGEGQWSNDDTVKFPVSVTFDLIATPAP